MTEPRPWKGTKTLLNSIFNNMSPRERKLAIAAGSLVVVLLVLFTCVRSMQRLSDLDRVINNLENQLVKNTELAARGVSVDRAFEQVAAQHSSEWTPAEIHDRLRREIQRLALIVPDGGPGKSNNLVEIPILRQGTLKDSEQGYREYSLSIRPTATSIKSIVTFLIRLQKSPQSLRIDGLELSRATDGNLVTANINVTRIVVAGTPNNEEAVSESQPGFFASAVIEWKGAAVDPWQAAQCDLEIVPQTPDTSEPEAQHLKATAAAPNAEVFLAHDLEPGTTYELAADIAASGPAMLQVVEETTGKVFEGSRQLNSDNKPYRHRVLFTVPESAGKTVRVHAPVLKATDAGVVFQIDNVILVRK